MRNKNGFSRCAEFYIGRLRKEGRYSTAHVYKNALFSFSKFCGTLNVSFRQVTRESLRRYGQYLYECGLKPNTISTYMLTFAFMSDSVVKAFGSSLWSSLNSEYSTAIVPNSSSHSFSSGSAPYL